MDDLKTLTDEKLLERLAAWDGQATEGSIALGREIQRRAELFSLYTNDGIPKDGSIKVNVMKPIPERRARRRRADPLDKMDE